MSVWVDVIICDCLSMILYNSVCMCVCECVRVSVNVYLNVWALWCASVWVVWSYEYVNDCECEIVIVFEWPWMNVCDWECLYDCL